MLQAMNGPQTPQTAAPAPALRFGDFEESTVASGFASAPRAVPPSQVNPPCQHCQISPTKYPSAALLVSILAGPCAAAQGRRQKRTSCPITSLHACSAVTPCSPPPSGPSLAAMHTIGMSVQAPPAQQSPPLAPQAHSSAPGQPRAQQKPAQPAPPRHMSAPPQQQQQQQMEQPQRPPLIATPALR